MSIGSTNPQDLYKNVVNSPAVNLDPALLKQQQDFVQALQTQANGGGPSLATNMLKQQGQQNAALASGAASATRGVNAGLAQRNALQAGAQMNRNANANAANARIQEQQNAQGMLGNQLNGMQGQNMGAQQATQQGALGAAGINAGLAGQAAQANSKTIGSLFDAGGSLLGFAGSMLGGGAKKAEGGMIEEEPEVEVGGPASFVGKHFAMAKGGAVPIIVSPGEKYLSPEAVKKVATGKKDAMAAGKTIPGEAKVKGAVDSYANDVVPKKAEAGGIVIPRSITQAKDAPEKAAAFVRAILAKQGLK